MTDLTLEAAERAAVLRALHVTGWNKQSAAQLLGVAKSTLYRAIRRHAIEEPVAHDYLCAAPALPTIPSSPCADLPTSCVDRGSRAMVGR